MNALRSLVVGTVFLFAVILAILIAGAGLRAVFGGTF